MDNKVTEVWPAEGWGVWLEGSRLHWNCYLLCYFNCLNLLKKKWPIFTLSKYCTCLRRTLKCYLSLSFFFFYLYPLLNSHSYIIINLSMEYFIRNRKYIFFSTKQKFFELIRYIRLILNTWNKHERMETVPSQLRSIDSFFKFFLV